MSSHPRVALAVLILSLLPLTTHAQDACGCNAALVKDLVITESARSQTEDFLNIIDDRLFEEFKSNTSLLAKVPIVRGIVEASANFDEFRQRRQSHFQQVHFSSTVDESFRRIQLVTSEAAYPAWSGCKMSCNTGPGLSAWKVHEDAGSAVVAFRYVPAPGVSNQINLSTSTVAGGFVDGSPAGRLFSRRYRLQPNGSDSVSINRRQMSAIVAVVKGGGYTASPVESRWGSPANSSDWARVKIERSATSTTPLDPQCAWTRTDSGQEFSPNNDNEHCDDSPVCSNGNVWRATRLTATLGPAQNTVFSSPRITQCIARLTIIGNNYDIPNHPACQHIDMDENGVRNNGGSAHLSLRASSYSIKLLFCADRAAVVSLPPTVEPEQRFNVTPGHTFSFYVPTTNVVSAILEYSIEGNSGVLRPGDSRSNDERLQLVGAPLIAGTTTYYEYRVTASSPRPPTPTR